MTTDLGSSPPSRLDTCLPRLHLVTDDDVLARPGWLVSAVETMDAGRSEIALHVRGPHTDGATLFSLAKTLSSEARRTGSRLVVNDRVDVALTAGAGGVHLGGRSLPLRRVRSLLGPGVPIGVSTHAPAHTVRAAREGAEYAFMGTVFPTPSHGGLPGIGLSGLREAVAAAEGFPVLGIGGVDVERVGGVMDTGAYGVAIVRGAWDRSEPSAAVLEYLQAIGESDR